MKRILLYLVALVLVSGTAHAWEDDTSVNNQITPTGLNYFENEVKTNQNGVTYAFIIGSGSPVSMRLQIVTPEGERIFSRTGELISKEQNNTWFGFNQYMEIDKNGDVFVGVEDRRNDPENQLSTYTVYKYSAQGTKLMDGVLLNNGRGYILSSGLSMCATDDGGVVCAFNCINEAQKTDYVVIEKLDRNGKSLWIKTIYESELYSNPIPYLTDAGEGRVMALIACNGGIKAQIMTEGGETEFAQPKTVYTGGMASPKVWEVLQIDEMAGNKAAISVVDGDKQGRLLIIDGKGNICLDGSDKGIMLNTDYLYASDRPAVTYDEQSDTYTCAYKIVDYKNTAYSQVMLQKINGADGTFAWSEPKVVLPFSFDDWYAYPVLRNADNGRKALFFMSMNPGNYNDVKAYMQLIEEDGSVTADKVAFATSNASKQTLRVSELVNGQFVAAWDEKRTDQMSLYMQNIRIDGTTGISNALTDNTTDTNAKKEYFTTDGIKTNRPTKGINLVRTTTDGKVKTAKVLMK